MTNPETLQDAQRVIERLRGEITRANQLLEYYRDFAPDNPSVSVAPPGFFTHQIGNQNWAMGRLINGQLHIMEQGIDDDETAVAAAWKAYQELVGRPS